MTPQERQLVDELFTRLSALEPSPREADAVAAINEGLRRAPNAIYALVQTVLLQDEALKQAHARLQQYEGAPERPQSSISRTPPGVMPVRRSAAATRSTGCRWTPRNPSEA